MENWVHVMLTISLGHMIADHVWHFRIPQLQSWFCLGFWHVTSAGSHAFISCLSSQTDATETMSDSEASLRALAAGTWFRIREGEIGI